MPAHIIVIRGPMFSAKSRKLREQVANAEFRGEKAVVVRPKNDRHDKPCIVIRKVVDGIPRDEETYPAKIVETRKQLRTIWSDPKLCLLGIDEGQMWGPWLPKELAVALDRRQNDRFKVVVAGLNLDYKREPFHPMPAIMAMARKVKTCYGVCMKCRSRRGEYTQRLKGGTDTVQPGNYGDYEVRCLPCHTIYTG